MAIKKKNQCVEDSHSTEEHGQIGPKGNRLPPNTREKERTECVGWTPGNGPVYSGKKKKQIS